MSSKSKVAPMVVGPNEGRVYSMGRMSAIFKADLGETNSTVSVSEWWLEPNTEGPHAHAHPEAHVYYVIEGSLAIYLQDQGWLDAVKGSYIYIPGDTEHSFENRSQYRVRFVSFNTPGGFESKIPSIVDYFQENPLGDAHHDT